MKINLFCFGFGQVAKSFVKKLICEKININLSATSTKKTQEKKINKIKYKKYQFVDNKFDKDLFNSLKQIDHILISIPPINGMDLVINNFGKIIQNCQPKWITYLSATSVYGDHQGKWVDENSETKPKSSNGTDRLSSEKSWLKFANQNNLPLQIFRLSGIYSNQNNILLRLKSGKDNLIKKKNHFFSRIHVDDIANVLFKSLSKFKSSEIYNISDDKPCSSEELILYGAKILDIHKPKTIEVNDIKNKMLRNFYNDSKKVSNKKMKSFFNYQLKFPTYIEGLNHVKNNFV